MLRPWHLDIQWEQESGKPIYLQIADAVIKDIQSGRLKAGDALPGSRNIAQLLKVNRNTVVEAFNVLLIEGWLVSRERSGTFVADVLPVLTTALGEQQRRDINRPAAATYHIRFDDGHPDSKIAPVAELARAYRQLFQRKARWQLMGYGSEYGDLEFRKSIVQMLNYQRGMQVEETDICITRGSQMAMYLAAQCLFKPGDYVLVENPGYQAAWKAFQHAGATLLPVKTDKEGMCLKTVCDYLLKYPGIKAIYTTPHHQYPTTVTLSLQRRLELIRLSNSYGFTIIEDDYDNEFHFGYRPILPLSSHKELKNYLYVGTLSKVVAPALRIGYLVCPDHTLMEKVGSLRKVIDVQGDSIMEQAVLQLIQDGTIRRHIRKATVHYKTKRDHATLLLDRYLKDKADYTIPEGGLAVWVTPKQEINWMEIAQQLQQKSISFIPPDHYSYDLPVNGIRIGYGSLSAEQLEEGIAALAACLP